MLVFLSFQRGLFCHELASMVGCRQLTIVRRSHSMDKVNELGVCVTHILSENNVTVSTFVPLCWFAIIAGQQHRNKIGSASAATSQAKAGTHLSRLMMVGQYIVCYELLLRNHRCRFVVFRYFNKEDREDIESDLEA